MLFVDVDRGRLDESVLPPISFSVSPADVRLVTRINPNAICACNVSRTLEAGDDISLQGVP